MLFASSRCCCQHAAFGFWNRAFSLLVGWLMVAAASPTPALGNDLPDDLAVRSHHRRQLWNRFIDQLSALSPEEELEMQLRAEALGEEYFRPSNSNNNAFHDVVVTDDILTRHLLQQGPLLGLNLTAPTRQCGEIIAELSVDDVRSVGSSVLHDIVPAGTFGFLAASTASALLDSTITYGVIVQKICSSCQDISNLYAGAAFLSNTSDYGFGTYCGSRKYGYNVTTSGLLMLPIDPSTGKVFTNRTLRSAVFTHGTTTGSQRGPSGLFPDNITASLMQPNRTVDQYEVGSLFDIIPALIGASAGTVVVMPDNIGYGESFDFPKAYLTYSLYQQASMSLWLAARHTLLSVSTKSASCTPLDDVVTVTGYSEGGYSALSTCLAFNELSLGNTKIRVLRCQCGGSPLDLDYIVSYAFEQLRNHSNHPYAPAIVTFFGNAYSSTDPDLPNSNKGQDALISPYKERAPVWLDSPTLFELVAITEAAGTLSIVNPNMLNLYFNASTTTPEHACSGPGLQNNATNLLCQAIVDNMLVNPLLSVNFPTVICHAKDDHLVPFGNLPNFSSNPFVRLYDPPLPVLDPRGNHQGGNAFCVLASIFSFANPANESDPPQLMSPVSSATPACLLQAPTPSPTMAPIKPTSPTKVPLHPSSNTTSSGSKITIFWSSVLAVVASSALLVFNLVV